MIDWEKDYTPLPKAAKEMDLTYSAAYHYCKRGLLAGAVLYKGTRWLVANRTIEAWQQGERVIDWENEYTPLPRAAEAMGLAYSTAYRYLREGVFEGSYLFAGTRWLVPDEIIEAWQNGEINIKGTFGKRNRDEDN